MRVKNEDLLKLKIPPLPRVSLEKFVIVYNYSTRRQIAVREASQNLPITEQIRKMLENDERVKRMAGKLVSTGGGNANLFGLETLITWFIDYAGRHGLSSAIECLQKYLNEEQISYFTVMWVIGIGAAEKIPLTDSVDLVPIDLMPDSDEKEDFEQIVTAPSGAPNTKPRAALIAKGKNPKLLKMPWEELTSFSAVQKSLSSSALILNLIPGLSCLEKCTTSYLEESVPPGNFGGQARSSVIEDVPNAMKLTEVTPKIISENRYSELYNAFQNLEGNALERWRLIISRLSQAKRRSALPDKILDLGIAVEMALLQEPSDTSKRQLALDFRLRGARILSEESNERSIIYDDLKEIYDLRSAVAHNGFLTKKESIKLKKNMNRYETIGSRICSQVLLKHELNREKWKKILLG